MPHLKDFAVRLKINLDVVCALVRYKLHEQHQHVLQLYSYGKSFLRMHELSFYTPLNLAAIAFKVCFLKHIVILMRHQMRLYLCHKVHDYDYDDQ